MQPQTSAFIVGYQYAPCRVTKRHVLRRDMACFSPSNGTNWNAKRHVLQLIEWQGFSWKGRCGWLLRKMLTTVCAFQPACLVWSVCWCSLIQNRVSCPSFTNHRSTAGCFPNNHIRRWHRANCQWICLRIAAGSVLSVQYTSTRRRSFPSRPVS